MARIGRQRGAGLMALPWRAGGRRSSACAGGGVFDDAQGLRAGANIPLAK
jgi:hypothetical protein